MGCFNKKTITVLSESGFGETELTNPAQRLKEEAAGNLIL